MLDIVKYALQTQQEIPSLSAFIEGPPEKVQVVKDTVIKLHEWSVQQAELCPELVNVGIWGTCKVFPNAIFGDFVSDDGRERFENPRARVFVERHFNLLTIGYVLMNKTYLLALLTEQTALALEPKGMRVTEECAKGGDRTHA